MRNIVFGIVIAVILVFGLRYCEHQKENQERLEANTAIIQRHLQNVGKLIVTEGEFTQVFSYDDSKKYYPDFFFEKKALIKVNTDATISYDLNKIETIVDQDAKTLTIKQIPEPELKINSEFTYYDLQQGLFNKFSAEDYNKAKDEVETLIRENIMASNLVSNAENRLISELQKIYILTNSMGWTLVYNNSYISGEEDLSEFVEFKD